MNIELPPIPGCDPESPLQLLQRCGGYYECEKDQVGKRLKPLVGYAGTYDDGAGEKKHYVGDVFANFPKIEEHGPILGHVSQLIIGMLQKDFAIFSDPVGFCGAPLGGLALASTMAVLAQKRYIFPEKEVTKTRSPEGREESMLVFDRHEPQFGEDYWMVEDVCNNFSTTGKLVALIESFGARVKGVVCFLNRSLEIDTEYSPRPGLVLPVVALWREKIMQYRQDDPFVSEDVKAGNVCWKPKRKEEWAKLTAV